MAVVDVDPDRKSGIAAESDLDRATGAGAHDDAALLELLNDVEDGGAGQPGTTGERGLCRDTFMAEGLEPAAPVGLAERVRRADTGLAHVRHGSTPLQP